GSALGFVTPTVGTASLSVSLASAPRSVSRRATAKPPATRRITSTIRASRPLFGGGCCWFEFGALLLVCAGLCCSVSSVINRLRSRNKLHVAFLQAGPPWPRVARE